MKKYLLYQAYGSDAIIQETQYALLSLARVSDKERLDALHIVIYTDRASDFALYKTGIPHLIIREINADQIKEWRGKIDFVHRVKIEVIMDFCSTFSGAFLYIDSDTFFIQNPLSLFDQVDHQRALMHVCESSLDSNGVVEKKLYKFFKDFEFDIHSVKQKVSATTKMWNAGVIGLLTTDDVILNETLLCTDIWYSNYKKHVMEQLAFSYIINKYKEIRPCDDFIYHYWNFKEFRLVLRHFFEVNQDLSFEELVVRSNLIMPNQLIVNKLNYENTKGLKKLLLNCLFYKWKMPDYTV